MTPRAMSPISADVSSDASSERNLLRSALCLAVFLAMAAGLISPAAAQRYVGGNSTPSVTVDYSVLDELGRAPNVPQLILQNSTGSAYRNNPYRGRPRFPVISKSNSRVRTKNLVLTPPTASKWRASRRPARKTVRQARRTPRNRVVRRAPLRKQPLIVRKPKKLASPPPLSIGKIPNPIAPPPPPKIAAVQPRRIAKPAAAKAVPAPPKAPEPSPLPPKSTAPKPKQIARSFAPPLPAPPKAATRPPPATRKVVASRSSAASRVPKAKPTPAARARSKHVASLPQSTVSVRSGSLRWIEFPRGSAKLSNKASIGLQNVAAALSNDAGLRIQLLAYAGQNSESASRSRRLSLSRALAARSKLIEQGVGITRIDVRALGNKSAGGPADRIDIIFTKR